MYVYMYMYVCKNACMYACINVCIPVRSYECMDVRMYMCMYAGLDLRNKKRFTIFVKLQGTLAK